MQQRRPSTRTLPQLVWPSPRSLARLPREVLQLHLNSRDLSVDGSRQQLVARLRKAYHPHGLRGDVSTSTPRRRTTPSAAGDRGTRSCSRSPPATSRTVHRPQHGRESGSQRSSPFSAATHSESETAHSHLGDIGSQWRHASPSQHSRRRRVSPSPSRLVAPSQRRGHAALSHHSRHTSPSQQRGRTRHIAPSQRRARVSSPSSSDSTFRRRSQHSSRQQIHFSSSSTSTSHSASPDHSHRRVTKGKGHRRRKSSSSSRSTSDHSRSSRSTTGSSRSRSRHRRSRRRRKYRHSHQRRRYWSDAASASPVSCAPPMPSKLRRKIRRGEYVEFKKLLLPINTPPLLQPITKRKHTHKEAKRTMTDLEAWNRFLCCHLSYFPTTALEMAKYQTLLVMLFAHHPPQQCLEYDRLFCQTAAQDTSLRWDTIKEDIYVWAITKKGQSFRDKSTIMSRLGPPVPGNASSTNHNPPNRETHNKHGKEICKCYNLGRCTLGDECVFAHSCWQPGCHEVHPGRGCTKP